MVYLIPFLILITLTYKLIRVVRKAQRTKKQLINNRATAKARDAMKKLNGKTNDGKVFDDVTPAFVCVIVVFMVCQLFNPLRRFLTHIIDPKDQGCWSFLYIINPISGLGIMVNSAANFVIFVLVAKGFRNQFIAWFR